MPPKIAEIKILYVWSDNNCDNHFIGVAKCKHVTIAVCTHQSIVTLQIARSV
jgi:hypothetical protein